MKTLGASRLAVHQQAPNQPSHVSGPMPMRMPTRGSMLLPNSRMGMRLCTASVAEWRSNVPSFPSFVLLETSFACASTASLGTFTQIEKVSFVVDVFFDFATIYVMQ